jgi:hypothetical protein
MPATRSKGISELKKLGFEHHAIEGNNADWAHSIKSFNSQMDLQHFLTNIPSDMQKELALRIESNMATSEIIVLISQSAWGRLLAEDFAAFINFDSNNSKLAARH